MRVSSTIKELMKQYGNDLKVVNMNFVVHPQTATIPAEAACAADKQGKFGPMEELIWEKGFKARDLGQPKMDELAKELGLDMNRFHADMGAACKEQLQKDQAVLRRFGVRGTPGFFINGRFLGGNRPIEQFKTLIDEELKKANERIAKGTKVENYYKEWVLDKGKKSL